MKELHEGITELVIACMVDDKEAILLGVRNLSVYPLNLFTIEMRTLLITAQEYINKNKSYDQLNKCCVTLINQGYFPQDEFALLAEAVAFKVLEREKQNG